jgi:hypothetical protein
MARDQSPSPPENSGRAQISHPRQRTVTADFNSLRRIPAPDASPHPAFRADPFSVTSDAPQMVTTTKKEEIKRLVQEARRKFDEKERLMEEEEAAREVAGRQGKTTKFESLPRRRNAFVTTETANSPTSFLDNNPYGSKRVITDTAISRVPPNFVSPPQAQTTSQTPRASTEKKTNTHPCNTLPRLHTGTNRVRNEEALRDDFTRLRVNSTANEETNIYDILNEGNISPPNTATPYQRKLSFDSSKFPSTPASETFDGSLGRKSGTGIRKVTGKIKSSKTEKEKIPSESAPVYVENLRDLLVRPDLASLSLPLSSPTPTTPSNTLARNLTSAARQTTTPLTSSPTPRPIHATPIPAEPGTPAT